MRKTLRVRTREGWVTKPVADAVENSLLPEEVDDNFLAVEGNVGTPVPVQTGDIEILRPAEGTADWLPFDGQRVPVARYSALAAVYSTWDRDTAPLLVENNDVSFPTGGTVNGIAADETYVYVSDIGTPGFHVYNKSDGAEVTGLPSLGTNGRSIAVDDNYLYVGNGGLTVIDKSDWSVVSGTPVLSNVVYTIVVDTNYVYLGMGNSPYYAIMRKSDWGLETVPAIPNRATGFAVDASYLYISHYSSPGFTVLDITDWSVVAGTPSFGTSAYAIEQTEFYVHISIANLTRYEIIRKSDWFIADPSPPVGEIAGTIVSDAYYVYIMINTGLLVMNKATFEFVEGITVAQTGDFDKLYIYGSELWFGMGNGPSIERVDRSNDNMTVPLVASPVPGKAYKVKT